jgi:hypothetical protein
MSLSGDYVWPSEPLKQEFRPCKIYASRSSMPLSVRFRTDSAMTPALRGRGLLCGDNGDGGELRGFDCPQRDDLKLLWLLNSGQLLVDYCDGRTHGHDMKNLYNIARAHPDAAVTDRFPNAALLRGAVNIDAAVASILVAGFCPLQPENPRYDGIASARVDRQNFAAEFSMFENRSFGQIFAKFSAHAKPAQRGLVAAKVVPETELRGRNGKLPYNHPVLNKGQSLLGHTDHDFHMRTRSGALSVQEILSHDEHQGRSQWKSEGRKGIHC